MINNKYDQEFGNRVKDNNQAELFSRDASLAEWHKSTLYAPCKKGYLDYHKKQLQCPLFNRLVIRKLA